MVSKTAEQQRRFDAIQEQGPTYRIKGLMWEEFRRGWFIASTPWVTYNIVVSNGFILWGGSGLDWSRSTSIEAAKAAAEAHYRERILTALEVVG